MMRKARVASIILLLILVTAFQVNAQQKNPNIVVIMTDDVGVWNISAYHRGMTRFACWTGGNSGCDGRNSGGGSKY
jgi:hypothetical protein